MSSYYFGLKAESFAAHYLRLKLYNIIGQRVRNHAGEIDIIAARTRTIVFVEVKARAKIDYEALTTRQSKRIRQAAEVYLASKPKFHNYDVRFDLILLAPWHWPVHLENAW
jgi:putative endonuclease